VVRIHKDDKVLEAFKDIAHWKITGIAVLAKGDVLVGNISSSDLKAIVTPTGALDFAPLYMSAENFIQLCRTRSPARTGVVVAVREYDTISTVLRVMAQSKIHRVYVVDAEGRLSGVVSARDVLRALCPLEVEPKGNTTPRRGDPDDVDRDEGDDTPIERKTS